MGIQLARKRCAALRAAGFDLNRAGFGSHRERASADGNRTRQLLNGLIVRAFPNTNCLECHCPFSLPQIVCLANEKGSRDAVNFGRNVHMSNPRRRLFDGRQWSKPDDTP